MSLPSAALLLKYSSSLPDQSPLITIFNLQSGKKRRKMAVPNIFLCIAFVISLTWMVEARIPGIYSGGAWESAHATFYGGSDASGTMG